MAVAKRQRKEKARENRTKEGLRTRVRISDKTNKQTKNPAFLASPIYIGQSQGEEKKTHEKRNQIWARVSLLFVSFGSACSPASRRYFRLLAK